MKGTKSLWFATLIAIALLHSCSTPKTTQEIVPSDEAVPQKAIQSAATLKTFSLSGAMSARNPKKGWSAAVNWQQLNASDYKIRLFGPLGSGAVMLEKQGREIVFKDGKKIKKTTNPDALFSKETGVRLPVANLFYWVRGVPAPGAVTQKQVDSAGRIMLLRQSGYQIVYEKYSQVGAYALPGSITLTGHDIRVRFVIKQWRV